MKMWTKYSLNFPDDWLCHRAGAFDISVSLESVFVSISVTSFMYIYFCKTNDSKTPVHLRKTSPHFLQKDRYFPFSDYSKLEK